MTENKKEKGVLRGFVKDAIVAIVGGLVIEPTLHSIKIDVSPHIRGIWFVIVVFLLVDALVRNRNKIRAIVAPWTGKKKTGGALSASVIGVLLLGFIWFSLGLILGPKSERNTFSVTGVTWIVATANLGKFPCAETPTQRMLPDGTCQIKIPPSFSGTGLHVEVKMTNTGESKGEDVYWHGGAEVSAELDDAGEDALFTRLTSKQIAVWPEFKVGETRSLTVINDKPEEYWNSNRVRYVMLRGSFHNESGKQPDVELCKWYGGRGKLPYEEDRPAEYCKGHNIGIDRPKLP